MTLVSSPPEKARTTRRIGSAMARAMPAPPASFKRDTAWRAYAPSGISHEGARGMNKYLLGGAAAAAIVAIAPAIAQTAQPAPIIQRIHVAPKAHTRAEVGTHVRTMFERLDTNRDGFVTKAEAQA